MSQKGVEDGTFWSAKASDYLRAYFHAAALARYDLRTVAEWVSGANPDIPGAWYPLWWPPTKIAGRYLAPYLFERAYEDEFGPPPVGFVDVDVPLSEITLPG